MSAQRREQRGWWTSLRWQAVPCLIICLLLPVRAQESIPQSASDVCPIKIGSSLPSIMLEDIHGTPFDLNASIRSTPTILVFYRGGWCPFCNRHLSSLRFIQDSLRSMGFQLLAISPDRGVWLKQTMDEQELGYTLLSDHTMEAAITLGIAYRLDNATFERYETKGYNLEGRSEATHHLLPVPAVFVIDTDEVISFSYVNPNYKVRLDPDVLLAAASSALLRPER